MGDSPWQAQDNRGASAFQCRQPKSSAPARDLTDSFVLTLFPHRETWLQWSIFKIIIYVYTFCIYPA